MRWRADYVLLVRMSGVGSRMTKLPVNGEDDSYGLPPGLDISVAHPAREAYAKLSLKKYRPIAARNEDAKVSSGLR